MPITNVEAQWSGGALQFIDKATGTVVAQIDVTGLEPRAPINETVSANKTLDAEDVGKWMEVNTDAVVITLPATAAGLVFRIRNVGADGAVGINVSPQALDKIMGPDIAGVDNKDLINTKATAKKGDYVILIADGVNGYFVLDINGTWAAEA